MKDISERKLSSSEMDEREKNVKGMKKSFASFRKRYGDRAKEVMYATATKMAKEEFEIEEGMSMKDFKANRKKNERRSASADAEKRGHVGKEWHNTGRKYSPDEAKSRRANMSDDDRRNRYGSAEDPDSEDYSHYPASKTKNPKKLRKQKAMGEQTLLPESYALKPFKSFLDEGAAWTRKEGQNSSGGLNEKGRKSYERENPGSDLKAPSKEVGNPRRASFCARMKGMRKRQKPENNTGDDRLSKSLKAWNC